MNVWLCVKMYFYSFLVVHIFEIKKIKTKLINTLWFLNMLY